MTYFGKLVVFAIIISKYSTELLKINHGKYLTDTKIVN
jgi:ribonuclease HIII